MGLPRFSRVAARIWRPPTSSSRTETAGRWFSSKLAEAFLSWSPVATTSRLRPTSRTVPSLSRWGTTSAAWAMLGSTRRICSVAVRPMMSLARAVSCTPGSCTTTRSAPCCWITASATPSSLTRFCSVSMFCLSACDCTSVTAVALRRPVRITPPPGSVDSLHSSEGSRSASTPRAACAVAASGSVRRRPWGSRTRLAKRIFLSRSAVRASLA